MNGEVGRKRWFNRWWFRIIRLPLLIGIVCLVVGSCMLQWTGSSAPAQCRANPELLREEVRALTEDFGTRYFAQDENLAKVRAYIRSKFAAAGAVVEEQEYRVDGRLLYNVRGFIGDRKLPRVIIGAHYDSCVPNDGENPGADDNASGVAGLFGVARLLQHEPPTGACVELVAYCTEEPPFFSTTDMGSYRHAELLHDEGVVVKGVLVLEMIGYFSDEPASQAYPMAIFRLFYPSVGNFISVVGGMPDRDLIATCKQAMQGSAPLPVMSSCIPRSFDFVHLSDHRNYWPFGYDSVMIGDTAIYRNKHYHTIGDTWQTLDYERMAHVVTQVHEAVLAVAAE